MKYLINNKLTLIGVIIGALSGYLYYYYIGCSGGSCPITSKPINSSLYGAALGGLIINYFKTEKSQ